MIVLNDVFSRLRRRFRPPAALADTGGASAVEFALAAPVMLAALIGLIEVSMILFSVTLMEGGVRQAARFGITGFIPTGTTREQQIVDIVNQNGIGLITVSASDITTFVYPDFDTIGDPEPFTDANGNGTWDVGEVFTDINCNAQWDADMGRLSPGFGGEIVVYRLDYNWPMLTGFLDAFIGTGGEIPLSATIAVRNEPFGGTPPTC